MANPTIISGFDSNSLNLGAITEELQNNGFTTGQILTSKILNQALKQLFESANKNKNDGVWEWEDPTTNDTEYNIGSLVVNDGDIYLSLIDLNTIEPTNDGTNWIGFKSELALKAYIEDVYTKTESDTLLDLKANNLTSVFPVDTMTDLLSIDENIHSIVNLKGYTNANDGGGGVFNWDSTIDKSTANTGTIIDPSVSLTNQGDGVGFGCWVRQYSGAVNVKCFDTVQRALDSELPLDWGDEEYIITDTLSLTTTKDLYWKSSGAKIIFSPAISQRSVISLVCGPFNHSIDGVLIIDANQKAFIGFNGSSTAGANIQAELTVKNIYRADTSFAGGDGILLTGYFENIVLDNPVVKNCFMATGAGISGSQGIFGITVTRSGDYEAVNVVINNPYIENVYSEDGTYVDDQDGIRIFARYAPTVGQSSATARVNGGYIKNVRGRSVKGQVEQGFVDGLTLIRDASANDGVSGVLAQNADIEMQTGGGSIQNIQYQYDDYLPRRVTRFIQAGTDTELYKTGFIISNINGVIRGGQELDAVVEITTVANVGNTEKPFIGSIDNIVCQSETAISSFIGVGGDGDAIINCSNLVANVADYLVVFGGSLDTANIRIVNAQNLNAGITDASVGDTALKTLTVLNSIGFNQPCLIVEKDGLYDRTNLSSTDLGVFYRNNINSKVHILGEAGATLTLGMGTPTDDQQGGLVYSESAKTLSLIADGEYQAEADTGTFRPSVDNTKQLGSSSRYWSQTFTNEVRMKSPNGTSWTITVNDSGNLVVV